MKQKERLVWFNGSLVPEKDARISIYDSSLMFGDMVFEMIRSFNKKPFKLREHLKRLYDSIKFVQIPLEMPMSEMEQHVFETMKANEPLFEANDEHRVLIDIGRGLLPIYQNHVEAEKGPIVIIADVPLRYTVV